MEVKLSYQTEPQSNLSLRQEKERSVLYDPLTCVIMNPVAGGGNNVGELKEYLTGLSACEVYETTEEQQADFLAHRAVQEGFTCIVAAGGDGTLHKVINGIFPHSNTVTIGLLPLGTGNDFARSLGMEGDWHTIAESLSGERIVEVDLISLKNDKVTYLLNASSGGFGPKVDEKLNDTDKKTWGAFSYYLSATKALSELESYKTTITFNDNEVVEEAIYNIVVANGQFVAGGLPIAPGASYSDGEFDVIIMPAISAVRCAVVVPQILLGVHQESSDLIIRRAKKLTLVSDPPLSLNADGELIGTSPVEFQILPRALRMVLPSLSI